MRYPLDIPEFTRTVWASDQARLVWQPRIQRISHAFLEIERLAVADSVKPAALQVCSPEELPLLTKWASKKSVTCIPLARQGASGVYNNRTQSVEPGKVWNYRVVYIWPENARSFIDAWDSQDDERIGWHLGFPSCCRQFFTKYWVKEGWTDLTFPMVMGEVDARELRVHGPVECNILLRWLGVRLVSHLPCCFVCDATETIGKDFARVGIKHGFEQEIEWLYDMLNWPVRWSSLHGIAVVTTPVLKIITDSTAVKDELVVERDGPVYPPEGVRGIEFPFKTIHTLSVRRTNNYSDNGFSSQEAQDRAHGKLLEAVLTAIRPNEGGRVIDLGCGNGELLNKIGKSLPFVTLYGIEINESRFHSPSRSDIASIYHGDLGDEALWNPPYRLALISINRLKEMGEEKAKKFVERLADGCASVIFYAYGVNEWPGLGVDASGLFILMAHFSGDGTTAMLVHSRRNQRVTDEARVSGT